MTSHLTKIALLRARTTNLTRIFRVLTMQTVSVLLFGLGLLLWPASAGALPIYLSGSDTITHDADLGDALPAAEINGFALPATQTVQYSNTISDSTGSSTGIGGLNHFESPTVVGFDAPSGIGVDQTDIDTVQAFAGAASLKIDFTATWDFTTQFGPGITWFINAPISGTVGAGTGGFVQFIVSATATAEAPGTANHTWTAGLYMNSTPGPFNFFYGVADPQTQFFAANKKGTIGGTIEFIARSGTEGGSSIHYNGDSLIVPEPSTLLLLGPCLVGLCAFRIKRRR